MIHRTWVYCAECGDATDNPCWRTSTPDVKFCSTVCLTERFPHPGMVTQRVTVGDPLGLFTPFNPKLFGPADG